MSVPSALRAPAPVNLGVGRLLKPLRILLGWRLRHVWPQGGGRFVLWGWRFGVSIEAGGLGAKKQSSLTPEPRVASVR